MNGESKTLIGWEITGLLIDIQYQLGCLLPDLEFSEISHLCSYPNP